MKNLTSRPMVTNTTLVPAEFMEAIGYTMVAHAEMDTRLRDAIILLSGMDHSAGISFLAEVLTIRSRVEIFHNLARTKADSIRVLAKMLTLGDIVVEVSNERNIIAHRTPYAWSPSVGQLLYLKDENMTRPQIKIAPPYTITKAGIYDLAERISKASMWLGMLQPQWLPDGVTDPKDAKRHPAWDEEAEFPWPEKYEAKLKAEKRQPRNAHLLEP